MIVINHHIISFLLNRFSVKYRFRFPILHFFTVKSPGIAKRSVSQENAFKKGKNRQLFLKKKKKKKRTIGSGNFFTPTENNFRFLR